MLVVAVVSGACVLSECSYVFLKKIFFVIFSAKSGEAAGCTYSSIWNGSTNTDSLDGWISSIDYRIPFGTRNPKRNFSINLVKH